MERELKILFCPLDGIGHINPCIGLAKTLTDRGHHVVFATIKTMRDVIIANGFDIDIISGVHQTSQTKENAKNFSDSDIPDEYKRDVSPIERVRGAKTFFLQQLKTVQIMDPIMDECIKRCAPDLIVFENVMTIPSVVSANIPWVMLVSGNPLLTIDDIRTPPAVSGLGFSDEDRAKWEGFRSEWTEILAEAKYEINKWFGSKGLPPINTHLSLHHSPHLNIYCYPEEIDYTDVRPVPSNWFRVESFQVVNKSSEQFILPEKLRNQTGKLIYFSLGTLVSANIYLMRRLIGLLSQVRHRFIISLGQFHDKYELADNMWGERTVDQLKVIALVDAVITHGGNNSLTECLYFGKPMIVMPGWGDQVSNAQRIHEKGFGRKLNPFTCTLQQIIEAIDYVSSNANVRENLAKCSERIRSSNSLVEASKLIEKIAK